MKSFMVMPAMQKFEKVLSTNADCFVLDLEDGLLPEFKQSGREYLKSFLASEKAKSLPLIVRINGLSNEELVLKDLDAVIHPNIRGIVLPKINSAQDVIDFDEVLGMNEEKFGIPKGHFKIHVIIEGVKGLASVKEILSASPRTNQVSFGIEDFITEAQIGKENMSVYLADLILASKAQRVASISPPCVFYSDANKLIKECQEDKALGFEGKLCIHPSQVAIVNEHLAPTLAEIAWSKTVLEHQSKGQKIYNHKGRTEQFVGPPHFERAEAILSRVSEERPQFPSTKGILLEGERSRDGILRGVGEKVFSDAQITVSDSIIGQWYSSFAPNCFLNTSKPVANKLGFRDRVLPQALMMMLSSAFITTKITQNSLAHLGLYDVKCLQPIFEGDTIRNYFTVTNIREITNGTRSVVESVHEGINEKEERVFSFRKRSMFPKLESRRILETKVGNGESELKKQILSLGKNELRELDLDRNEIVLKEGEVYLHQKVKVLGKSEVRGFSEFFGITNSLHHNVAQFPHEDILVPGPFVFSAAFANIGYDFGQILSEEYVSILNLNKVNYEDLIASISFIENVQNLSQNPNLQEVTSVTLGIKNFDIELLQDLDIPLQLFKVNSMKPQEYEQICLNFIPCLFHRIVSVAKRKFLRINYIS
jgi:citrate lyase subunit beta / citryl-CoA lyase